MTGSEDDPNDAPRPPRASWESPETEEAVSATGSVPPNSTDDPLAPLPAASDAPAHDDDRDDLDHSRKHFRDRGMTLTQDHDAADASASNAAGPERAERRRGKLVLVLAACAVVGATIAGVAVVGHVNSNRFVISCEPEQVRAVRGRAFPPWGTSELDDARWKPIKIPPEAECRERETDAEAELSAWYLELLWHRATVLLEASPVVDPEPARALLEQALLHTRDPARRDRRAEIERMLGDVQYWRAAAKLRAALTELEEVAQQFEAAALQQPRFITDAAAWGQHLTRALERLRAGPTGPQSPLLQSEDTPQAPGAGSAAGAPSDDAPPRDVAPEPVPVPAPTTPDAGVPTGGVLL